VTAFALDPAMVNIRQQGKDVGHEDGTNLVAPLESANAVAFISAITQVPAPTLGECWRQVLSDSNSKAYTNLRENLDDLEKTIESRNQERYRNVDFNPKDCCLSISS